MTSRVEKALVIADPWIGMILDGSKTWEMRSSATRIRGRFGLIRKGTGAIWGVATLVDCGSALSPDEMIRHLEKHRIPEAMITSGEVAKWNHPWMIRDVRTLPKPVAYNHRPGAVTWVNLEPSVTDAIQHQLAG